MRMNDAGNAKAGQIASLLNFKNKWMDLFNFCLFVGSLFQCLVHLLYYKLSFGNHICHQESSTPRDFVLFQSLANLI